MHVCLYTNGLIFLCLLRHGPRPRRPRRRLKERRTPRALISAEERGSEKAG